MNNKIKFIILSLGGLLFISLLVSLQTHRLKQVIVRERDNLKKEKASLSTEIEETLKNNQYLQEQIQALNLELDRLSREREEWQKKFTLADKERQALLDKLIDQENAVTLTQDSLKLIKDKNEILKRQLKSLYNRKVNVEKRLTALQKEDSTLSTRLSEMERLLDEKDQEIDNLRQQLVLKPPTQKSQEEQRESVELAPIIVRPRIETQVAQQAQPTMNRIIPLFEGNVLAVNRDYNFVIIDLGEESGIKEGLTFQVYREGKSIADIEVIQTRKSLAACDIKKQTTAIKVGDTIR